MLNTPLGAALERLSRLKEMLETLDHFRTQIPTEIRGKIEAAINREIAFINTLTTIEEKESE